MLDKNSIQIASLSTQQVQEIVEAITSLEVSYSIDEASQISFQVIDPQFKMAENGYFTVGREIIFTASTVSPFLVNRFGKFITDYADGGEFARASLFYEMASVTVGQNGSNSPTWTIKARPKAVQQMKRDRQPKNIKGSGSEFVQNAARKYGLFAITQNTNKSYKINSANGSQQATSTWDAMKSIADEAEFVLFEADGVLYFGQEKWLLNKWGTHSSGGNQLFDSRGRAVLDKNGNIRFRPYKRFIPISWPPGSSKLNEDFRLIEIPNITQSDNDAYIADGSFNCERMNGTRMRPGMTVKFINIPNFAGEYIVTQVSYREQSTDPVSVSFRTPAKLEDEKIKDIAIGTVVDNIYKIYRGTERDRAVPVAAANVGTVRPVYRQSPTPTAARPMVYPAPNFDESFIIEAGNISLWDRPIYVENRRAVTTRPFIHVDSGDYVVLERVWCQGGSPALLSEAAAITKYGIDDLHLGKFSDESAARSWVEQLLQLAPIVIQKKFPTSYQRILAGVVPVGYGC